jgi:L-ascorbate metabolism protein UlaG (beta-lactamase superfamily)
MVNFEGMNLCFLGGLINADLNSETLEHLEDIDILFVPVGGSNVLDSANAYKLAVKLEPSLIIPCSYDSDSLKKFLKESGDDSVKTEDKLVVKKKDLDGKEGEVVVLKEE